MLSCFFCLLKSGNLNICRLFSNICLISYWPTLLSFCRKWQQVVLCSTSPWPCEAYSCTDHYTALACSNSYTWDSLSSIRLAWFLCFTCLGFHCIWSGGSWYSVFFRISCSGDNASRICMTFFRLDSIDVNILWNINVF